MIELSFLSPREQIERLRRLEPKLVALQSDRFFCFSGLFYTWQIASLDRKISELEEETIVLHKMIKASITTKSCYRSDEPELDDEKYCTEHHERQSKIREQWSKETREKRRVYNPDCEYEIPTLIGPREFRTSRMNNMETMCDCPYWMTDFIYSNI